MLDGSDAAGALGILNCLCLYSAVRDRAETVGRIKVLDAAHCEGYAGYHGGWCLC